MDGSALVCRDQLARRPRLIRFANALLTSFLPRSWRTRLPVKLTIRWLLPHWLRSTFPVAVILNRRTSDFLVFILGMTDLLSLGEQGT